LDERLGRDTRAHWIEKLTAAGIPCGSVRDFQELFADAQIGARSMTVDVPHPRVGPLRVLGTPLKLSATPPCVRTPPPLLGEHTDAILTRDLGCTRDEIAALRNKGII
jgi:formyl-CoA transferase